MMGITNLRKDGYFWLGSRKVSPHYEFSNGVNNFAQGWLIFEKPSFENIIYSTQCDLSYGTNNFAQG